MALLTIIDVESSQQNLTVTRLLKLTKTKKSIKWLPVLYRYLRYAESHGIIRVDAIRDPRPFSEAKYYFLTKDGEELLRAYNQCVKEEKKPNGN